MGKAEAILTRMRNNPSGDWRIEDLERVAGWLGINSRRPGSGSSHVIFTHPASELIVSVPAHRPIRPVYVRNFLVLVNAVRKWAPLAPGPGRREN